MYQVCTRLPHDNAVTVPVLLVELKVRLYNQRVRWRTDKTVALHASFVTLLINNFICTEVHIYSNGIIS